jgi:hypothetical protein
MSKIGKATIWADGTWINVRTPYDKDFVAALKNRLPYGARKWDGDQKVWQVDPSYDTELMAVLETYFEEVNVIEQEQPQIVAALDTGADPYAALLRFASDETLKKCYRMVALDVHPDRGGSSDSMTQANMAWDAIKKERGI